LRLFIQLGSRRVHAATMTAHPDATWMAQQARQAVVKMLAALTS
jgi:hypothetical protein